MRLVRQRHEKNQSCGTNVALLGLMLVLIWAINGATPVHHANAFVMNSNGRKFRQRNQGIQSSITRFYASQPEATARRSIDFTIRHTRYSDLNAVSKIILDSFYPTSENRSPFRHLYRLSEMNRLQQNFPYADSRHSMLSAVVKDGHLEIIVGFVDVDARPPKPKLPDSPPRPYLSDLAVLSDFRQCGIAKALIRKCEEIVKQQFKANDLYIRVEQKNDVAIRMYSNLKYNAQTHPVFGVKDTTTLLHKELTAGSIPEDSKVEVDNGNKTSMAVVQYV